jgi:uncharacterized protein YjiS (DUF1127 family)
MQITLPRDPVALPHFAPRLRTVALTLALWRHRARSRRHLATLDDRELADIGVSRAQRNAECGKRFWQS